MFRCTSLVYRKSSVFIKHWLNKTIGIKHSKNKIRNEMNAAHLNSLVAA